MIMKGMITAMKNSKRGRCVPSSLVTLVVACLSACSDEALPLDVSGDAPLEASAACALSNSDEAWDLCEVGRVVDGDTLVIDLFGTEVKVRLAEIDAPESRQEYGSEATALLESFVAGENFELVNLGPARYGRVLAHLHGEQGCINQRLVEQGAAWHYEDYSDSTVMAALQNGAKSAGLGLWGRERAVAPWDFRRGGSGAKSTVTKKRELSEVVSWTGSGSKYHKESCRYLSKAKVVNTGSSPPSALTPCSVCFEQG